MSEVAWATWEEWDWVRRGLLPGGDGDEQGALDQVAVWRARGPLAQAVEATADLVSGLRACEECGGDRQARLALALVIARMVSGLTDRQQTGVQAQSVSQLAKQLGLPPEASDIRHTVVHNALPSTTLLCFAAKRLLGWLETSYWEPQWQQTIGWATETSTKVGSLLLSTRLSEDFGPDKVVERLVETIYGEVGSQPSLPREAVDLVLIPSITRRMMEGGLSPDGGLDHSQTLFWTGLFTGLQDSSANLFGRSAIVETIGWRLVHRLLGTLEEDRAPQLGRAVATAWITAFLCDPALGRASFDQTWPSSLKQLPLRRIVRASMLFACRQRNAPSLSAARRLYAACGAQPHPTASALFARAHPNGQPPPNNVAVRLHSLARQVGASAGERTTAVQQWRACPPDFSLTLKPGAVLAPET